MTKQLEKIVKAMGYENILDFLECIDDDGYRGTKDLEYVKKELRKLNNKKK